MKWFKHQSDARNSLKLRKVRRKYGADGYAIYWFCLEAIAYDVDKDNLTFELKEDAETIGFELTIQEKRVIEIMEYMVSIGLFESSDRMITCMKLAESIDKSMTNSPKLRKWLEGKNVMTCADDVKVLPDAVNTCAELDIDKDKNKNKNKDLIDSDRIVSVWNSLGCKQHRGMTKAAEKAIRKSYKEYCKSAKKEGNEAREINDWLEIYLLNGFTTIMTSFHQDLKDGNWAADLEFATRPATYDKVKNYA